MTLLKNKNNAFFMIIKFLKIEFLFFKGFQVTNGTHMYLESFIFPSFLIRITKEAAKRTLFRI
ncbi:MAG: hypothetical protein DCE86_10250 [Flavobacteriaceae bacterium]|nr:hypothetical protein ASG38_17050 [Flavobacterium sp. Leaf359]PZO30017.1 MAG: hypothetical protein DCE86_10250 [Flavobacteriaceae bacterium]